MRRLSLGAVPFLVVGTLLLPEARLAAQVDGPVDPQLTEAIGWYTGSAGRVDDGRAWSLLLEAAADGDVLSRMWVARVHARGRMGFPEDPAYARALADTLLGEVRRLAEDGVVEAMFLMGTAYDEGLGVEEDPGRAALWHRRAADAGHLLAHHVLGNQYAEGRGVPRDPARAVRWWLPPARAGDAVVQLRLGEAYEAGRGVPRDPEEALRWYREAADRGNEEARAAVERLGGAGTLHAPAHLRHLVQRHRSVLEADR